MSGVRRVLIALLLVLALCGATCQRKPELPEPGVAVRPVPVVTERRVYVPVPAELTRRVPIAEGPIPMCFEVSAQRRAALEQVNARLEEIEAIQGTEAKP
jgi:hypothetical protein